MKIDKDGKRIVVTTPATDKKSLKKEDKKETK